MVEDKSVQQMQATGARVLQSSPGLAEKLVASGKTQPRLSASGRDDRDAMIADLQRQLDSEKEKNRGLEDQYKYRVATFMKRETQTKNKIDSLEKRLNDGPEVDEHSQRMAVISNMHQSVVAGIDCIQNHTAKVLQDQEKDLMRAFRSRLQEVTKDLEAQRSRKDEDSTQLLQRHRRVISELHEAQELAASFDKKNQQLDAENKRLKERLQTREDDRQALLRELVMSKKEVTRLKAQVKEGPGGAADGFEFGQATQEAETKPLGRSISQRQIDQELNGTRCRVVEIHEASHRLEVRTAEGGRLYRVRPENLVVGEEIAQAAELARHGESPGNDTGSSRVNWDALQPGASVRLAGLHMVHYNGLSAVVLCADRSSGRCEIQLGDGSVKTIRAENLRVEAAEPPAEPAEAASRQEEQTDPFRTDNLPRVAL